jgi:ribosomal protein S18 acetylase RimI-like enzyme
VGHIAIRSVTAEDWPRIGDLSELLVRAHHAYDAVRFVHPDVLPGTAYTARVREEIAEGRAIVRVAHDEDRIVGYVFAGVELESWKELRHRAGYIHDIVVEDRSRHLGIGRALMADVLEWFAAHGVAPVMLWTAPQNVDAQRLFVGLGFRATMVEMMLRDARTRDRAESATTLDTGKRLMI